MWADIPGSVVSRVSWGSGRKVCGLQVVCFTYAEILALAPQQAQSEARLAILSPSFSFDRSGMLPMSAVSLSVTARMHLICWLRDERVVCVTLPRSQEQRFGAFPGGGQKGIGSWALGQMAKYCCTKSWYLQE